MTADTVGGVWTYAVELSHALARHDVEVHVATMARRLDAGQRAEAGLFAAVHESSFPLEWMDDPWAGVDAAGDWLLDLEHDLRPDVVHLNGYVHAALRWHAPVLVAAHSDVVSWSNAVHGAPPPGSFDTYRRRVAEGLRAADRLVAPTHAVAGDLRRSYGVPEADVAVVPNCRRPAVVDAVAGAAPRSKEALVLAAGRVWDEAKGIDRLCRVAPSVPASVAVAGDAASALPGVEQLGSLPFPELATWLSRAAVYAAPARYEPFGLGILEAALAGCALVVGDLPSLREVWGEAATFVHDDASLQAALRDLLADPGKAAARGADARARALTFSPERTAAGYLQLYAAMPVASGGAR